MWGRDALLRIPLIISAGDELPLLVTMNLLGIEFLSVKGMNSAGDDFPIATLLGIALLDFTGDNLP